MALESTVGQERAAALLRSALKARRLAHAYLFVGPAGVGRLAMARELAALLLCSSGKPERCGSCRSCRLWDAGNHPDYHEVGVPEGKQELPIAAIRDLQHHSAVKPVLASRRVFVIREAERMNEEAANCFLKTLEEPPGDSCFILIVAGLWDMPQTVVSRCQIVRFFNLPAQPVEELLRKEGASEEEAWWLARRAWGSPGQARAFREIGLHKFNRELAERVMEMRPEHVFELTDRLSREATHLAGSRPEARVMLQDLLECLAVVYRDLAVASVGGKEAVLFNKALEKQLRELAGRFPLDSLVGCIDRVFETIERIGGNANRQVALDEMFTELSAEMVKCGPRAPAGK
jgi:DNA polymerase-3 subunit delta'